MTGCKCISLNTSWAATWALCPPASDRQCLPHLSVCTSNQGHCLSMHCACIPQYGPKRTLVRISHPKSPEMRLPKLILESNQPPSWQWTTQSFTQRWRRILPQYRAQGPKEAETAGDTEFRAKGSFWAKELGMWLSWMEKPTWLRLQRLAMPYPQGTDTAVLKKFPLKRLQLSCKSSKQTRTQQQLMVPKKRKSVEDNQHKEAWENHANWYPQKMQADTLAMEGRPLLEGRLLALL